LTAITGLIGFAIIGGIGGMAGQYVAGKIGWIFGVLLFISLILFIRSLTLRMQGVYPAHYRCRNCGEEFGYDLD
jgi:hypothetical protein